MFLFRMIQILLLFTTSMFFLFSISAEEKITINTKILTDALCETALANDNVSQTVPFPPLHQAFPYGRGLLDTSVPVTVENLIKSKTLGLMEWGLRIYPAHSYEDALLQYNKGKYHEMSMQTWFLILPKDHPWKARSYEEHQNNYKNLPDSEKEDLANWEFRKLIREGAKVVYLHKTNISRTRIEKNLVSLKEQAEKQPNKRTAIEKFIKAYEHFLENGPKAESYHYKSLPIDIINQLPGEATEDKWTEVPQEFQAKLNSLHNTILTADDGEFFFQSGWFLPEVRGVIYPDDFLSRSTSSDLQKFMRALFNKGYHITFNQQPRMVIESAGDQVRAAKQSQGDSRFSEELLLAYEQMIRDGKAYSIEIWHPTGILAGGTFGMISNGSVNAESVFYPNLNDPDVIALKKLFETDPRFEKYKKDPILTKSIDMAKLSVRLLLMVLKWHGYAFLDAEMVTPFTQSMSGQYVWVSDFHKMRADAAKHAEQHKLEFPAGLGAEPSLDAVPMKIKDFVKKHTQP